MARHERERSPKPPESSHAQAELEDAETDVWRQRSGPDAAMAVPSEASVERGGQTEPEQQAPVAGDFQTPDQGPLVRAADAGASARERSVELAGQEADAARRLAEAAARDGLVEPTEEIDPRALHRVRRECRMCGKRIGDPIPVRFRRPRSVGFRCEHCNNIYCADHVVRISGAIETVFSGARFCCPLCMPPGPSRA